jgi:phosphoribosylglycinamide formyltransferase-1
MPAFLGARAVADALAHGVALSGCTVHLVDATLDGGPIVAQEAVPVVPGDDEATLHDRIRAVEHRILPRVVGLALAGALTVPPGTRGVAIDVGRAEAEVPVRAVPSCPSATRPPW